jgi:hypothetical protein
MQTFEKKKDVKMWKDVELAARHHLVLVLAPFSSWLKLPRTLQGISSLSLIITFWDCRVADTDFGPLDTSESSGRPPFIRQAGT